MNISLVNGLLFEGTKILTDKMLTSQQCGFVYTGVTALTLEQYYNTALCLYRVTKLVHREIIDREQAQWGSDMYTWLSDWGPNKMASILEDDTFDYEIIFENIIISIKISLTFVTNGPINNILAMVRDMTWCRPGDKPLSESLVV